ncbi:MAG: hypothetical protein U0234_12400 [Sandaracinus sp.]
MTLRTSLAAALLTVVLFVPSLASAQREPSLVERPTSHAVTGASAHGTHLRDEHEQLRPPSAGEWVLPIGSIILGAGGVIAGGIFTVGALLGLALEGTAHLAGGGDDDTSRDLGLALGASLAGLAVGAVLVGVGAAGVASLRHRARETSGPNLLGVSIAPTPDGLRVTAYGRF